MREGEGQIPQDPVYRALYPIFNEHLDVFVNQDMVDGLSPRAYQAFLHLRHEHDISEAEFLLYGARAMRHAHRDKVRADNMTPGDIM